MNTKRFLFAGTLAGVAVLMSTGCSSMDRPTTTTPAASTRFSPRQMCTEAGGTYNQGTCSPATSALSAKELCETRAGTYFEGGDYCEVPAVRSR
ncbi:MAG: hypothetical protein M3N43_03155 [Actinomycetota bacterium]|nr:hypothetical protein [Actinomycetota bacterium]